jgi:hypothetical protein
MKQHAVVGGDAARFLPAVLQGVKAERCDGAGVFDVPDGEYPAFEAGSVIVRISPTNDVRLLGGRRGWARRCHVFTPPGG